LNKPNRLQEFIGGDIPGINTYPREAVELLDDALLFSSLTSFYRRNDMQINTARYKAYEISPFPKLNLFNAYSQIRVWDNLNTINDLPQEDYPSIISILNDKNLWKDPQL
jgi:hypothetical protein